MNGPELEVAHSDLMGEVKRFSPWLTRHGDGRRAPARVPRWVLPRLERHARVLGYPVTYHAAMSEQRELGATECRISSLIYEPDGIRLLAGMSPASTARVLCHEIAHAQHYAWILSNSRARVQYCRRSIIEGTRDRVLEEAVAETTAALITRALRLCDGDDFSLDYLHRTELESPGILRKAKAEAIMRARATLEAIA